MTRAITILLHLLYWIQGVVRANDVIQPNIIWANMGQLATINCKHTKDAFHNQMYWFRQHQGESMKLIAYTATFNKQPEFGEGFDENKFTANKTVAESGSLTVNNLGSTDSAVYFCAVSKHSVRNSERGCTKTAQAN
ncbi:hypothetical protein SRHO_G00137900 [Serrasalmus rhombeus]